RGDGSALADRRDRRQRAPRDPRRWTRRHARAEGTPRRSGAGAGRGVVGSGSAHSARQPRAHARGRALQLVVGPLRVAADVRLVREVRTLVTAICGIVGSWAKEPDAATHLATMLRALEHRGGVQKTTWADPAKSCRLAVTGASVVENGDLAAV